MRTICSDQSGLQSVKVGQTIAAVFDGRVLRGAVADLEVVNDVAATIGLGILGVIWTILPANPSITKVKAAVGQDPDPDTSKTTRMEWPVLPPGALKSATSVLFVG